MYRNFFLWRNMIINFNKDHPIYYCFFFFNFFLKPCVWEVINVGHLVRFEFCSLLLELHVNSSLWWTFYLIYLPADYCLCLCAIRCLSIWLTSRISNWILYLIDKLVLILLPMSRDLIMFIFSTTWLLLTVSTEFKYTPPGPGIELSISMTKFMN